MTETGPSFAREIELISNSESMLRLIDALKSLDRDSMTRVLAAYLFFKSRGRDKDLVGFLLSNELGSVISIAFRLAPAIATGLLVDGRFRSLFFGAVSSSIRGSSADPRSDRPR